MSDKLLQLILRGEITYFNEYRKEHPDVDIFLPDTILAGELALDLSGIHLNNADLTAVRFENVKLVGADLSGADLSGAFLMNVDLSGADLTRVILTGATLFDCKIAGTMFEDAHIEGTIFSGTTDIGWVLSQLGFNHPGIITGGENRTDIPTPTHRGDPSTIH